MYVVKLLQCGTKQVITVVQYVLPFPLQTLVSWSTPSQFFPNGPGLGQLQDLYLVCVPSTSMHFAEQVCHSPQPHQFPSTKKDSKTKKQCFIKTCIYK